MTQHPFLPLIFLTIFSFSILIADKKSSKDIQKDIDSRTTELQSLRKEIKIIEERLHLKNKEAISTTEVLIDLENKIILTEKLIRSINKEEQHISGIIQTTENLKNNFTPKNFFQLITFFIALKKF